MLRTSSYPFLPSNRGDQKQQVAPVRDWRSDCLEKQGESVVEICGVLGRLHSGQGLAQSNNNAKLNNSAKHRTIVAGNRVQKMVRGCWKNFQASIRCLNDVFWSCYDLTNGKLSTSYRKF